MKHLLLAVTLTLLLATSALASSSNGDTPVPTGALLAPGSSNNLYGPAEASLYQAVLSWVGFI